jgi:hypothetical protein
MLLLLGRPGTEGQGTVTPAFRLYFATVGLFAIWVGVWGYGFPGLSDQALPWLVPPLHARFIGSMYLSGAVLMFGALAVATPAIVRIPLLMATVWTGMLGLVSFLHLDQFDWLHSPVWFWFFAYVAFPVAGAILAWQARGAAPAAGAPPPFWLRLCAGLQAAACIALAAVLFFAPDVTVGLWPWKITPLLAQIYAGPFLSYGVGAALVAFSRTAAEVRLPVLSMAVFAALVLVASLLHLAVLEPVGTRGLVWFAGLSLALAYLLVAVVRTWRARAA